LVNLDMGGEISLRGTLVNIVTAGNRETNRNATPASPTPLARVGSTGRRRFRAQSGPLATSQCLTDVRPTSDSVNPYRGMLDAMLADLQIEAGRNPRRVGTIMRHRLTEMGVLIAVLHEREQLLTDRGLIRDLPGSPPFPHLRWRPLRRVDPKGLQLIQSARGSWRASALNSSTQPELL
jgi:hypothetical protein